MIVSQLAEEGLIVCAHDFLIRVLVIYDEGRGRDLLGKSATVAARGDAIRKRRPREERRISIPRKS